VLKPTRISSRTACLDDLAGRRHSNARTPRR